MKLITFAVPCYNSAAYMEKCVESLLTAAGEEMEILLIDDGSKEDSTPEICDRYARQHPETIRVFHQENGGHGASVNQGLRNAAGMYYKVVDSDDWLDSGALRALLEKLRELSQLPEPVDLLVCNYVYDHALEGTCHTMHYKNVFPRGRVFTWEQSGRFRQGQYLLMHSAVYRTELLRGIGLTLPKHTFYVDNIFVYDPLPAVHLMYYLDVDLYHYFIGRENQSVNEQVMVRNAEQQIQITRRLFEFCDLSELKGSRPKLANYMFRYLSLMVSICSIMLNLDGSPEALKEKRALWLELRGGHPEIRRRLRFCSLAGLSNAPGRAGRWIVVVAYRVVQRIFKFN